MTNNNTTTIEEQESNRSSTTRRTFLTSSLAATAVTVGMAGCLGGNNTAPPRKSHVFDDVGTDGGKLLVHFADNIWMKTLKDIQSGGGNNGDGGSEQNSRRILAGLSPVGTASAAKGRGASARGTSGGWSSAPKTSRSGTNWAIFYAGSYGGWRDDHRDELSRIDATVTKAGVTRIGDLSKKEQNLPGPGELNWDRVWQTPLKKAPLRTALTRPGWYSVGAHLASHGTSLGVTRLDFKATRGNSQYTIKNPWLVNPRY